MRDAFGPDVEISPALVWRIAMLDEIETRPQLIMPLVPLLGPPDRLDRWTLQQLVPILRAAGDRTAALRLNDALARKILHDDPHADANVSNEYTALGRPDQALNILRRTRPAHVRDWETEPYGRQYSAVLAFRALKRPHQALALAQHMQRTHQCDLKALLAELEADLALLHGD